MKTLCVLLGGAALVLSGFAQQNFPASLGMIETQPVCYTCAAIMSRDQEALVTVVLHHIDLVLRHCAK